MTGRLISGWELGVLREGLSRDMFQAPPEVLPPTAIEDYIHDVVVAMQAGRCWIAGYPEQGYLFLMWPKSYFVVNVHFFGEGGVWKGLRAMNQFIVGAFKQLPPSIQRAEFKVHDPRILAMVRRIRGLNYEGVQRKAFWGGGVPQDEHCFAFFREDN